MPNSFIRELLIVFLFYFYPVFSFGRARIAPLAVVRFLPSDIH